MKKKEKGGAYWWWSSLVIVAGIAVLAGYFWGMKGALEKSESLENEEDTAIEKEVAEIAPEPVVEKDMIVSEETEGPELSRRDETCNQIEDSVEEFFQYLDKKDYIVRFMPEGNTYEQFRVLTKKLSSQPPIPAGEGSDSKMIARNIFHFFRVLKRNDIRLIRTVLRNESESVELNLDLFYRWLMPGNLCSELGGEWPQLEVLYQYAGFFLNTIGGRAYLYRRPIQFRLLAGYYSLLIVHEADKEGKNSYGIDIFPQIELLKEEISLFPNFYFQVEYLEKLDEIALYYMQRR